MMQGRLSALQFQEAAALSYAPLTIESSYKDSTLIG
jgi:hypothetical protein